MDRPDRPADDAEKAAAVRGEIRAWQPLRGARRRRRFTRVLLGVLVAVGAYALLGYFALPWLAHDPLERRLSEALARPVSIGRIEVDPFLLWLRVHDLRVSDAAGGDELAGLDAIEVDFSWRSLPRLAPVISSLRIERPRLRLRRDAQGRYDIQDVLERWQRDAHSGGPQPTEPPRFSAANIVLNGGRIDFDDAQRRAHHEITGIDLRLPFVSSLPVDETVHVEPHLSAAIDGAPVELAVRGLPFHAPHDWGIEVELQPLDLARFAGYLPDPPPVEVRSGRIGAHLRISVTQAAGAPPAVAVRGRAVVSDLTLAVPGGQPLVSAAAIEADAIELEWPSNRHRIGRLAITRADLTARRGAGDARFFEPVLAAIEHERGEGDAPRAAPQTSEAPAPVVEPAPTQPVEPASAPGAAPGVQAPAPEWQIDELVLKDGRVTVDDERFEPRALHVKMHDLDASVRAIGSDASRPAHFDASLALADGGRLQASGVGTWQTGGVDATAKISQLALRNWWWIVEPKVALDLLGATASAEARVHVASAASGRTLRIEDGSLSLRDVALRQRWDQRMLATLPQLDVADFALDLQRRRAQIGELHARGGELLVRREADASTNLLRAVSEPAQAEAKGQAAEAAEHVEATVAQPPAQAAAAQPAAARDDWTVELGKLSVDGFALSVEDAAAGDASHVRLDRIALEGTAFSSARGAAPAQVSLRARVDERGALEAKGTLAPAPLEAVLHVAANELPLVPLQPYVAKYVDVIVSSGAAGFDGELRMSLGDDGTPDLSYRGGASVAQFAAVTKAGRRDLLGWKTLAVDGIDFATAPSARISLGDIDLEGLRSRLVISREGRLNLQDLLVERGKEHENAPAESPASGEASAAAPEEAAGSRALARIGNVRFTDGNVDFSDFFVRPNYSARITGLAGTVSALGREHAGDVRLSGRLDHTGGVEIRGQFNPLADSLSLDLHGEARDIDLPRLSPYSSKYVGYGIEKGKLSAKVEYKVVDRKLTASNQIVLDQLRFGDKVDSPDAVQLPVLLAVALLQDRNGVIDVNLPIEGSLDDPQFSIGGIVMRIIGNVIVKAVASPFKLLAGLAGAGDVELSWIGFGAGGDELDEGARHKLDTLAKALAERPGLSLEIAGHADRVSDGTPLRVRAIERRMKQRKLRDTAGAGGAASIDDVQLDADEYAKYLQQLWSEAGFPKAAAAPGGKATVETTPRSMLDDLVQAMPARDESLAALANRRAQAAKDWLADHGRIDAARLFITAARIDDGAPAQASSGGAPGAEGAQRPEAARDEAAGAAEPGDAGAASAASRAPSHGSGPRVELSLQ